MSAAGYVVRCEKDSGWPGQPHECICESSTLSEALADLAQRAPHYGGGRVFTVDATGRQTLVLEYAEALAATRQESANRLMRIQELTCALPDVEEATLLRRMCERNKADPKRAPSRAEMRVLRAWLKRLDMTRVLANPTGEAP